MKRRWPDRFLFLGFLILTAVGCGGDSDDEASSADAGEGTLEFYANGESFIRDGFTSMDGWAIDFDHFYVNVTGLTGYQVAETATECALGPTHAGHPHNDIPAGAAHVTLDGTFWVDLAQGTGPSLIGAIPDAPAGNYNYVNFAVVQRAEGEDAGYSIVMSGTATKETGEIEFTIRLEEQMVFSGCHQEIDDAAAGVVEDGGVGSLELTFHSDHLFGDAETIGEPDSVNEWALGFDKLAELAEDGVLDIDQAEMEERMYRSDYLVFLYALFTLGHSGEGHCNYSAYEAE